MRKLIKADAKATEIGYTVERGEKAQALCDLGWSHDRIASEMGVTRYAIGKWIDSGLIKRFSGVRSKRKSFVYQNAAE